MRETLWRSTQPIGVALVVLSMGVLVLTFRGRYSHHIMAPGLVRFFGVAFGVAYSVALLAMLGIMRSYNGLATAVCFMMLAVALMLTRKTLVPWLMHLDESVGHTFARHLTVAVSCAGGVAVGLGFASGWLRQRD